MTSATQSEIDKPRRQVFVGLSIFIGFAICYAAFSKYWWIFFIAGCGLTVWSFFLPELRTTISSQTLLEEQFSMDGNQFLIPQSWDTHAIGLQVHKIKGDSTLVKTFVDSIVDRYVLGQDNKTAKVRIEFLKTKLEELTLSKELQASLDELQFRHVSNEITTLELENKKSSLQMEAEEAKEIAELKRQRDALKIKLEIAEMKKKMVELETPPEAKPKVRSPEEARKEKQEQLDRHIKECEKHIQELKTDTSLSEESRRKRENILSKKLDGLYSELEKYA
jgi:hypothetical protein